MLKGNPTPIIIGVAIVVVILILAGVVFLMPSLTASPQNCLNAGLVYDTATNSCRQPNLFEQIGTGFFNWGAELLGFVGLIPNQPANLAEAFSLKTILCGTPTFWNQGCLNSLPLVGAIFGGLAVAILIFLYVPLPLISNQAGLIIAGVGILIGALAAWTFIDTVLTFWYAFLLVVIVGALFSFFVRK